MAGIPQKLLEELSSVRGFNEEAFLAAHESAAATSVRLHPLKPTDAFSGCTKIPWCADGRQLATRPVFTLDPVYHAGGYYVQEASSMFLDFLVKAILPKRNGLRVLDLCAAPGGKSTLLASLLERDSLLVSNEVIRSRASVLEENAIRWGYTNHWVASNDPRDFSRLPGYFDVIVVDAPCSGSGLFRKDAHALTEWSESNVALCSQRQQRIIADVWDALKDQGFLIYATCSYSPQEDEDILDWLAENFSLRSVAVEVPADWSIVAAASKKGMVGYRFFPDKVPGEGFFIAVLQKDEAVKSQGFVKYSSLQDKKAAASSAFLLREERDFIVQPFREGYAALNQHHEADFHALNKNLYLRKVGVALGSPAGKDWLPAHDIALSVDRNLQLPMVSLNKEQALRFLKKEEMNVPVPEKGWMMVGYEGLPLGWIKSLGNRINNYLPKHWRIRMELPPEEY